MIGVKLDAKPTVGKKEMRALNVLIKAIRHVSDRYEVGVLRKSNEPKLP